AVAAIRAWSEPNGLVEIGAGTGYWARAIAHDGTPVVAFDQAPPPSTTNTWFNDAEQWFPVAEGDHRHVLSHPERTLLLMWPTKNETWAADAVELFHGAGGRRIVYIGEPPGGRTGDDSFHAMTGGLELCTACSYGLTSVPCVCDIPRLFEPQHHIRIPNWVGFDDEVVLLERLSPGRSRRWLGRRRR
ncbi:MAG: hypothetical protein OSA99_18420, partial [Acidimicrobiales bacterium]|nr:hypothetical protein [Acidimicrobiales bacterium]